MQIIIAKPGWIQFQKKIISIDQKVFVVDCNTNKMLLYAVTGLFTGHRLIVGDFSKANLG